GVARRIALPGGHQPVLDVAVAAVAAVRVGIEKRVQLRSADPGVRHSDPHLVRAEDGRHDLHNLYPIANENLSHQRLLAPTYRPTTSRTKYRPSQQSLHASELNGIVSTPHPSPS